LVFEMLITFYRFFLRFVRIIRAVITRCSVFKEQSSLSLFPRLSRGDKK
jgi:hypothetical protein